MIYCSRLMDGDYYELKIKNKVQINIGSSSGNQIIYSIPKISGNLHLYFFNGNYYIEGNIISEPPVYVNDNCLGKVDRILNNGDRIFFMGLNIIYNNYSLFINNPFNRIKIDYNFFEQISNNNNNNNNFNRIKTNKKKYFIRPPRMIRLDNKKIEIKEPKINYEEKELPFLITMGPGLGMLLTSIITASQAIYNYNKGQTKLQSLIFSLMMTGTMIITSIFLPTLIRKVTKRYNRKNNKKEEKKYEQYIKEIESEIEKTHFEYRNNMNYIYATTEQCLDIIFNNSPRLWERINSDDDFLTIRLGKGKIQSNIELEAPKQQKNGRAYELMNKCIEKANFLTNAPVVVSLKEKNIFGITGDSNKDIFIQNILLQLITFHDYNGLKLVFLLNNNKNKKLNYTKMLPHTWNSENNLRFWSDSIDEFSEISSYLVKEFLKRKEIRDEKDSNYPYYLIIVDDYRSVENLGIIKEIMKSKKNLGFSILFLSDNINFLPNKCTDIVQVNGKNASLIEIDKNKTENYEFDLDLQSEIFFSEISKKMSNIIMKSDNEVEDEGLLPESCSFLEMYKTSNIESLNIWERWHKNDSTISLAAPIGVDTNGNIINLDIHEKYHGPHGLIAGSTGSGKSEFIITYILSLIINYHPDDVNFVLIDYKGGGLANAFERANIKIPHLVGTITNIDKSGLQRSLESLQSELKRRQIEFNNAKDITGESTIDIYKYQKYYHAGALRKNISHLFIICDEFAELKQQEPEIMDEIISIARIGRSLGVHLILATQKPSGIVNDQIRSNTKFGICLKVQSKGDSSDVIGTGVAANLKRAGQFYFKVGNDDYLTIGQSGWAGATYNPNLKSNGIEDNYVEFISNTGSIIKKVEEFSSENINNLGDQNTNIVKYVCDLAKKHNIVENQLWLENIPENIYIKEIRNKYQVKKTDGKVDVVIGEYDDPSKQKQDVMKINLTEAGNTAIYGNAESGKETLVSTMIYDLMTNYEPDEVNIYVIDFGMESTKIFKEAPQVGDVILQSDREKIYRLIVMLRKVIDERKKKLSKYGGDYQYYLKKKYGKMPLIYVVINNYDLFSEMYGDRYDEIIQTIMRDGMNLGIIFTMVVSTTNAIRYRMQQLFKHKIALKMNKDDDYGMIYDKVGKKRPSNLFGRGLVQLENNKICEYQTAKICKTEEWNDEILNTIKELNLKYKTKAQEIAIVPEYVSLDNVKDNIKDMSSLPIGIIQSTLNVAKFNFTKILLNIVSTNNLDDISGFILNIIEEIRLIKDTNYVILDAANTLSDTEIDLKEEYMRIIEEAKSHLNKKYVIIILGLNKFLNKIGGEAVFETNLEEISTYKNTNVIIFDSYKSLNEFKAKKWFSNYASSDDGIWIGPGFSEQFLFKSSNRIQANLTRTFGVVLKKSEASLIKVLGIKEKSGDVDDE